MEHKKTNSKAAPEIRDLWLRFIVVIASVVLINIIGNYLYKRFDLTTEKRYSLSDATKELLKNNKENIYIQVYLEGELETGFLRLQNATRDILKEMKTYSNADFEFEFVNPVPANASPEQKYSIYQEMASNGFQPTNLKIKKDDAYSEKIIFPSMKVSKGEIFMPIQILENQIGYSPEESLNHSIIALEYKIANAVKKLTSNKKHHITFLQGHEEYSPKYLQGFLNSLKESQYTFSFNTIGSGFISRDQDTIYPWNPAKTDLLIIAKPILPFSEYEKFRIDQYIMQGGKTLWLVDGLDADNNYLQNESMVYMTKSLDLNLDDLLFKYGVRINKTLIQDGLQSAPIPIIDNQSGEPMLFPWLYNPLLSPSYSHPIGKNLDPILSKYASHIDTIENNIEKHIILSSSQYGRFLPDPVRVHLAAIKEKPNLKYFNKPYLPAGVLLEGSFESVYKNRIKPEALDKLQQVGAKTLDYSVKNKMIVLSDGDLIQNYVSQKGEQYPLGFEMYSGQTFANADFLKNCVEYLIDEQGLLTARNKEIKLRMLDKKRTEDPKEALKWQLLNIIVPILSIFIFGIIYHYIRKRKWTS